MLAEGVFTTSLVQYSIFIEIFTKYGILRRKRGIKMKKFFRNIFKTENGKLDKVFITIFAMCVMVTLFVVTSISVDHNLGNSNEPTIKEGQTTIVMRHFYDIKVNDFIIFSKKDIEGGERINKRVVAVGGDHVVISDGKLYINDKLDTFTNMYYTQELDVVVPEGSYFVMGDNRAVSMDSRHFGCVNEDEILGKVIWY